MRLLLLMLMLGPAPSCARASCCFGFGCLLGRGLCGVQAQHTCLTVAAGHPSCWEWLCGAEVGGFAWCRVGLGPLLMALCTASQHVCRF